MRQARVYPEELKVRAVRLVFEVYEEEGSNRGAVAKVGAQLGHPRDALPKWVCQAEMDQGMRPGPASPDLSGCQQVGT